MSLFFLCLKIFIVRIVDVSLGTICTILTVRNKRKLAALLGFIEIFIWFVIVKEALNTDSTSIFIAISYAGGFATGTYIGSFLSEKFIKGTVTVQVITKKDTTLINELRSSGYAVSIIDVKGQDLENEKYMLFLEINKERFNIIKSIIKRHDPNAFVVVNETKAVFNGYFVWEDKFIFFFYLKNIKLIRGELWRKF